MNESLFIRECLSKEELDKAINALEYLTLSYTIDKEYQKKKGASGYDFVNVVWKIVVKKE